MHVLVTGLDGFTGKYLSDELISHGHTVVGLQSDLMDEKALNQEIADAMPEAVIHLAGISFVPNQEINHIYEVNLLGARNLLQALFLHAPEVKSVLLASSAYVYDSSTEGLLTETSPINPANDYAVSKCAMEQMAALWREKLPVCIVRPFNYTGVGQSDHFLIPKIVSHFKMKKPVIELGNLEVEREFGDVRSVAQIYRKLLDKRASNEILNISTGNAHSLKEAIAICGKITGHAMEINVNPLFVRPNEVTSLVGCNKRLKQCIGSWKEYTFEETLRWMLGNE